MKNADCNTEIASEDTLHARSERVYQPWKCISIFVTNILIPKNSNETFFDYFQTLPMPSEANKAVTSKKKTTSSSANWVGWWMLLSANWKCQLAKKAAKFMRGTGFFLASGSSKFSSRFFSKECQIWTDAFFCLALFFLSLRHENWRVHAQNTGNINSPGAGLVSNFN